MPFRSAVVLLDCEQHPPPLLRFKGLTVLKQVADRVSQLPGFTVENIQQRNGTELLSPAAINPAWVAVDINRCDGPHRHLSRDCSRVEPIQITEFSQDKSMLYWSN
jgi:hypothetical protein